MGACTSSSKDAFDGVVSGQDSSLYPATSLDSLDSYGTVSTTVSQNIVKVNTTNDIREFYEIEESEILGSGLNGSIVSCVHKTTNRKYALKRLEKSTVSAKDLQHIRDELECMAYLDHPNILRVVEVFESEECVCLVLQLCTGGDLLDRINVQYRQRFREKDACKIIQSILSAVAYCHAHNIVHRDLKLENILFETEAKDSIIKIIDFGLSKTASAPNRMTQVCGTAEYMAPEVIRGKYDAKCDVWSVGIITYMLLAGGSPFGGNSEDDVLQAVLEGRYELDIYMCHSVSNEARDFIRQCLTYKPAKRPTARAALKHKWFKTALPQERPLPSTAVLKHVSQYSTRSWLAKIFTDALAHTLPSECVAEAREQFGRFDVSDTGEITANDLRSILKQFNGFNEEFLETLLSNLNVDRTGRISYHEFLAATINLKHCTEENLLLAFELISSHRELITSEDIRGLLGGGKHDVEGIMQEVGLTTSSQIDFPQFKAILSGEKDGLTVQ